MDAPLKELTKLEKLTAFTSSNQPQSKSKSISVAESLDALLFSLRDVKQRLEAGAAGEADVAGIHRMVEERKKEIEDRQKEVHASLARYGKTLDKRFASSLPSSPPLFTSATSKEALERTVALHFMRTGQFSTAKTFLQETSTDVSEEIQVKFLDLHQVLTALRNQDVQPALSWCEMNREFLENRTSPLEFYLHRSQYMRLLLASNPPDPLPALAYARTLLPPLYPSYGSDINRLIACTVYLPLTRLLHSPYSDLASPTLHFDLEPMFAREYCARLGMSRQVPLRVVGDIGGGGALARIEKGRKVMRERKSEWSQSDELPIEIPLPPENRYHSIFACPVSKEQATASNPPMMMTCGHVVAKDSLQKLSKAQGRVKCPYCPQESNLNTALQVHF
ncbi:hypothetical protein BD410DRAFT_782593 [Rickenella mellea]|uniref:GID complex catalytic subunit 2 n=1 Tax=Rickenella mellea TaxID=50990 RepID=A0A4Y7QIP7_9AGAM|nr:hypothetical protein BD410DRAFT_782593 [Rickenella mellea]